MRTDESGGGASRTTDPAAGTSTATDVSLREHLIEMINASERRADLRFQAMKEQVEAAFASSQRAIDKADIATEKRFEGVNEFRAALSDQAAQFVDGRTLQSLGDKLQAAIDRNREDLADLSRRLDLREGQSVGTKITAGVVVTVITVSIAAVGLMIVLAQWVASK